MADSITETVALAQPNSDLVMDDDQDFTFVTECKEVMSKDRYSDKVQRAFWTGHKPSNTFTVSDKDAARAVTELSQTCADTIISVGKPVEDAKSEEFCKVKSNIIVRITKTIAIKAFLVAYDSEMFEIHFPNLMPHFNKFKQGNRAISARILKKFPFLTTDLKLNRLNLKELGYICETIFSVAETNKKSVRVRAYDEYKMIGLLASQWKGATKEGMDIAIVAVELFANKYPRLFTVYPPAQFLSGMIQGYSTDSDQLIDQVYVEKFKARTDVTPKEITEWFNADMRPKPNKVRVRCEISGTEKQRSKFFTLIKPKKCENDFYEVHLVSDTEDVFVAQANYKRL